MRLYVSFNGMNHLGDMHILVNIVDDLIMEIQDDLDIGVQRIERETEVPVRMSNVPLEAVEIIEVTVED